MRPRVTPSGAAGSVRGQATVPNLAFGSVCQVPPHQFQPNLGPSGLGYHEGKVTLVRPTCFNLPELLLAGSEHENPSGVSEGLRTMDFEARGLCLHRYVC